MTESISSFAGHSAIVVGVLMLWLLLAGTVSATIGLEGLAVAVALGAWARLGDLRSE